MGDHADAERFASDGRCLHLRDVTGHLARQRVPVFPGECVANVFQETDVEFDRIGAW